jgi:type III pantothenate kinase
MMEQGVDCIDYVDKMLTLEGLCHIYEKNKKFGPDRSVDADEQSEIREIASGTE